MMQPNMPTKQRSTIKNMKQNCELSHSKGLTQTVLKEPVSMESAAQRRQTTHMQIYFTKLASSSLSGEL